MSGPAQNIHNIYDPLWEHDACGIGAVVNLKGTPSHATVDSALKIVEKLEHRAGKDATGETGDGVGLMIQVPHKLMVKAASAEGIALGGPRDYGVGMFFFPADALKRAQAQKMLEIIASKEGLDFLGWRDVPTHPEVLGRKALDCMPCICQCFVARPVDCARGLDFDRKLYVVRREFEQSNVNTYICSFSSRTIVYKGMFLVGQLRKFYTDLTEPDCESAIALVHSRFSTNTTPSWERAHPNRYILHNGEINTIRGNVDRMLAREETMHSAVLEADMDKILPVVSHYRQAADSLLRGGGAGHPAGEDREEVPAPAGADAAGRPDCRSTGGRRRGQGAVRPPAALRRVARCPLGIPAGSSHPQPACGAVLPGAAGPAVQGLRLHL